MIASTTKQAEIRCIEKHIMQKLKTGVEKNCLVTKDSIFDYSAYVRIHFFRPMNRQVALER